MQNNNFRTAFTKKYSFVAPPTAFWAVKQLTSLRLSLQGTRERWAAKMPMNLRLMKLSNYEKTMLMTIVMFWASVEYLERYT